MCLSLFHRCLCYSDVPVVDSKSMEKVNVLLKALSVITFGDFDEMEPLASLNETLDDLSDINVSALLYKVGQLL